MRISLTPRSSSVDAFDMDPFRVDDSGHHDHLVPAHDERPRLALRAGDLRVDEHVLDLLAPPGEAVARAPGPYLKASQLRFDAPSDRAHLPRERDRRGSEPDLVVLADGGEPPTEVEPLRARARGEQAVES